MTIKDISKSKWVKGFGLFLLSSSLVACAPSAPMNTGSGQAVGESVNGDPISIITNCPIGYVAVPGSPDYSVSSFCVMQFEAKLKFNDLIVANGNSTRSLPYHILNGNLAEVQKYTPASVLEGLPWVMLGRGSDDVSVPGAIGACRSLGAGYDLISNAQWQTLARNLELVNENWTGGQVGKGCLFQGNTNDPLCGNDGGAVNQGASHARTKFRLNTGSEVYDVAGNVAEIMRDQNYLNDWGGMEFLGPMSAEFGFLGTLADGVGRKPKGQFGPLGVYSSQNNKSGIGFAAIKYATTQDAIRRGGDYMWGFYSGIFSTSTSFDGKSVDELTGFRCIFRP